MQQADEDGLAARVRRHDPDRYFCTLFAPASRRDDLFTIYAFNNELARAPEVASEPGLALIRLQWWRDVVEGQARRHEVATPLSGLIASGAVEAGLLLSMIAAREQAVEALPATMADFVAMMHAGAGALAAVAGGILGASAAERTGLRAAGAGYGLAGVLRNLRAEARQGRCPLPDEVLDAAGLSRAQAEHDPDRVLAAVGPAVRAACLRIMGKPVRWRRQIVAAALPGALARRDALRADAVAARGFGDRLAVLRAAALCVV